MLLLIHSKKRGSSSGAPKQDSSISQSDQSLPSCGVHVPRCERCDEVASKPGHRYASLYHHGARFEKINAVIVFSPSADSGLSENDIGLELYLLRLLESFDLSNFSYSFLRRATRSNKVRAEAEYF